MHELNDQTMNSDRHLWQYRWIRELSTLLVVVVLVWTAYAIRAVTLPILIGLAGAYVANPLVTWTDRRWKLPRWLTTATLLLLGLVLCVCLGLYLVPKLAHQVGTLIANLPQYINHVSDRLGIDWSDLTQQAKQALTATTNPQPDATATPMATQVDIKAVLEFLVGSFGLGLGLVSSAIGGVGYLTLAGLIVVFCFYFFSSNFDHMIAWFKTFIPPDHRQQVMHIINKMDASVSAFVRGRLIQALVMGSLLSIGWWLVAVPFWLLLGMATGLLNLIPYAGIAGWLAVALLTWIDSISDPTTTTAIMPILIWSTAIFAIVQTMDSWIVEPIVQGKATDLDPLTVFLAVLVGGSLAGLLGLIIAIPVAACGKIFAQEVLLPRLRSTRVDAMNPHNPA